jgi:hypothetical protein
MNCKFEGKMKININMQVFVKTINGKTIVIDINKTDRISVLKEMIEDRDGLPSISQRLSVSGKTLEKGHISDYNIERESTIHVNLSLRGG